MSDIIDAVTLSVRFSLELMKAIIRFPLMNHEHRKEIVKALMSTSALGQWKPGELSKANVQHQKKSTATKRQIQR